MHYDDIREHLQTGDMLCWSGTGLFSRAIQAGQAATGFAHAYVSHIGMVVRGDDLADLAPMYAGRVLTFESTTMNEAADVLTGQAIRGVSVVSLTAKMQGYDGRLYVRRLRMDGQAAKWSQEYRVDARAVLAARVREFIMRTHGTRYERKIAQLVASALPFRHGVAGEDRSSLFCSETYVECLEYADVLDEAAQDADAMCPAEVVDIERHGRLRPGYSFGELTPIVWGARRAAA